MSKKIYYQAISDQIPRLLGLLDRNAGSVTYGCFDRNYWCDRVVDFPSARYQEAVLTLVLIYKLEVEQNVYFKNPNILSWINASLKFWAGIQEPSGSFNEMYPHERAFVATAFTVYAVSETLLLLGEGLIDDYQPLLSALKKAGDWLIPRIDNRVVNQTCGSVIALYNIYLLTKEDKYLKAAGDKLEFLAKSQDKEGWFMEYGGADIGYLSLAIDYLAKYYQKSKDESALRVLEKAVSFIGNFIHPNYTFGGSYSSRDTEYIIPSGFEVMAKYLTESKAIAALIRKAIEERITVVPGSLNDRYLAYLGYTYLQAFIEADDELEIGERRFTGAAASFPNSGIEIIKNDNFYFVGNYKKGGAFKIVLGNDKVIDDWGVILESADGKKYFSGWLNPDAEIRKTGSGSFEIQTDFQKVKQLLYSPLKAVASRAFLVTFGLNELIGRRLREALRDILITPKHKTAVRLKRKLSLSQNGFTVMDKIEGARGIRRVLLNAKASYIYVISASFYQPSDLQNQLLVYDRQDIQKDNIDVRREYDRQGNLVAGELS